MRKTIKEVSELTGVSAYNLRFYEKKDLLHPERIGKNRYREYGKEDVKRVYQIKFFRELGVPVCLIGQALDHHYDPEEICEKAIICDNSVIQNCYIKGHSIIKRSSFIQNSVITGYSTIDAVGIAINHSKLKHCIAEKSTFEGIKIIRNECLVGKEYRALDIINTKKITRNYTKVKVKNNFKI